MQPTKTPRFLIIAPAWVGDMIMSQPLYQLLKQQHPNAEIDLVAPKSTLSLAQRMPEISQTHLLAIGHGQLGLRQRYQLGKSLRNRHYQQAFVLANTIKSAIAPWAAKIPTRTGWLGEKRYLLLNDIRHLDKTAMPLLVQRYAALAYNKKQALPEVLPHPKLSVDSNNLTTCVERLKLQPSSKPILALCPGGEYGPSKRWPAEYFAKVAEHYLAEGWQVWIFGSPKEKAAATIIQQQTQQQCVDLCGATSLLDAIDLLSLSQAVVTNDSGLMHIAAALEKSIVAIYGSTSPGYTPPLADNATILRLGLACSPCFKRECPLTGDDKLRCLLDITPEQVITALKAQGA